MTNYFTNYLELIKIVNDNYNHIDQLEKLTQLIEHVQPNAWLDQESIDKLLVIIKTTHNSHYDYRMFGHRRYQHPENHIDTFVTKPDFWLKVIDKSLVTADNDNEIYYSDGCKSNL